MSCLYTEIEIITGIKQAMSDLSDSDTENELDTSQSRHRVKRSPAQARKALSVWKDLLYQCYPTTYRENFGDNFIRLTTPRA